MAGSLEPRVVGRRDSKIAEIFRTYGMRYLCRHKVTQEQRLAIINTIRCRTPALGGHIRDCVPPGCGYLEIHFNSCRDRSCPICSWVKRQKWIAAQQARQLPVPTFLWTFTMPKELTRIARQNQKRIYALLFDAQYRALQDLASNKGLGQLGVTSILHTWSRKMKLHVHAHSMVTGGGFDGTTWHPTEKPDFQFPLRRVRALYRKHLLQGLHELYDAGRLVLKKGLAPLKDPIVFGSLMTRLWSTRFIVNVRPPQGKPENALKYLATYTRGIAISDYRILSVKNGRITFRTRDDNTQTLGWEAFIGRYLLHVLPSGLKKVRHYGIYSNSSRKKREKARQAVLALQPEPAPANETPSVLEAKTWQEELEALLGLNPRVCPRCKRPGMVITEFGPCSPETVALWFETRRGFS